MISFTWNVKNRLKHSPIILVSKATYIYAVFKICLYFEKKFDVTKFGYKNKDTKLEYIVNM